MPNESADIPEVSEERILGPFVEMAESVRAFARSASPEQRWAEPAYEVVYRHLMDHTVDHPGADISEVRLTEVQGFVGVAAKVAGRAPHHLKNATFRAVLGHLLYRMGNDE